MAETFHELDDAQLATMRTLKFGDWDAFEYEKIEGTQQKLDYLYQCIQDAAADREFHLRELRKAEQLPEIQEFDEAVTKYNDLSDRIEVITKKLSDILPDGVWPDWVFTRPYKYCGDPQLAQDAYETLEECRESDQEWELLKAESEELKSLYKIRETYADIAIDPPDIFEGDGLVHHLAFQEWSKSNKLYNDLTEKYYALVDQQEEETNASVDVTVDVIGVSSTTDTGDEEPTQNKIDHTAAANELWEAQRQLEIEEHVKKAARPVYKERIENEEYVDRLGVAANKGRLALNKLDKMGLLIGQRMRLKIKDIHTSEMLAFRGGVYARYHVIVQFTRRTNPDKNTVEVRFIDRRTGRPIGQKSVVSVEIPEEDRRQKLAVSTCMSTNENWPHYENNIENVPANLSQMQNTSKRGDVKVRLQKYIGYHKLVIKEMMQNNHI